MYAGSPYAGAPYAGGATSTAEVIDGSFAGMVFLLEMWADLAETNAAVVLPSAVERRFDVVRVLPVPDLVNGRPT